MHEITSDIEHNCLLLGECFCDSHVTLNASKCHLLVSSYNNDLIFATTGDAFLRKEVCTKLLEIIMDSSLTLTFMLK